MLLYRLLRGVAAIALRWYYRELRVVGLERVPRDAPVLLAANHPNALIDALVAAVALPRPVMLTAKATLVENPFLAWLFPLVGVVPLRRASDERARAAPAGGGTTTAARNAEAFRAILDALAAGRVVLIFPEGISHDASEMAPLKTGLARLALQARDERGVRGLAIVPLGLLFEDKARPRSRVLATVGEPVALDNWGHGADAVERLTAEVDARLRAVTLNFPTKDDAARVLAVSEVLAGVFDTARPLGDPDTPLEEQLAVVRRVDDVRRSLASAPAAERARVDRFVERLDAFRGTVDGRAIAVNDLDMSLGAAAGARFVVREGALAAVAGPLAWWGRVNHWAPLRLARWIALRTSASPEDPAMNTVVAGLALVLLFYALQAALVWLLGGPWWAAGYLATLPLSAGWDLRYQDRRRRAMQRLRTYLLFRREPALRARLCAERDWLRGEAGALDEGLGTGARD